MRTHAEIMNRIADLAHDLEREAREVATTEPSSPAHRKAVLFMMQRRHEIDTLALIAKKDRDDIIREIQREERDREAFASDDLKIPLMGAQSRLRLLQWVLGD